MTTMGRHGSTVEGDGQGDYDPSKTKDVEESSGGTHSTDDEGDNK
jgi:hypothetical protein